MASIANADIVGAIPASDSKVKISDDIPIIPRNSSLLDKSYKMSAVSKMYDLDGDGQLDEAERALRNMDKEGNGISMDKMYKLMQEHMETQRSVFKMKKTIVGLASFAVILALSNLGTSLVAAFLAKDTTTSNNALVDAKTGEILGTQQASTEFEAFSPDKEEASRALAGCNNIGQNSGTTHCGTASYLNIPTETALDFIAACLSGNNVVLARTFSGNRGLHKQICPSLAFGYSGCTHDGNAWNCGNGATAEIDVAGGTIKIEPNLDAGAYKIEGYGMTSREGQPCDSTHENLDCGDGLVCTGDSGVETCSQTGIVASPTTFDAAVVPTAPAPSPTFATVATIPGVNASPSVPSAAVPASPFDGQAQGAPAPSPTFATVATIPGVNASPSVPSAAVPASPFDGQAQGAPAPSPTFATVANVPGVGASPPAPQAQAAPGVAATPAVPLGGVRALVALGDSCTSNEKCESGHCSSRGVCACDTSTHKGCIGTATPYCVEGFAGPFCTACDSDDHCAAGQVCGFSCFSSDGNKSCRDQAALDSECLTMMEKDGYTCDASVGSCVAAEDMS